MTKTSFGMTEDQRRAAYHQELQTTCVEGFEAGTSGAIVSCPYWPGSPKRAVWEACRALGKRMAGARTGDPVDDRLDEMEGLMVALAGKVAELKEARGVGAAPAKDERPQVIRGD